MTILAIDTSTRKAGAALWRDGKPIESRTWESRRNHTAELMPAVASLLDSSGGASSLSGIAVSLGPGGFSSLRVGLSLAKGFAMALNLPIVGVGTSEAEAHPYAHMGLPVYALLDAGRGEVSTACFGIMEGRWSKLSDERITTPEQLVDELPESCVVCGEGAALYRDYLSETAGPLVVVIRDHSTEDRLHGVAALGESRLLSGESDSPATLEPLYLRKPSIGTPKGPRHISR